MIKLTDNLWVGNSSSTTVANTPLLNIGAVLNVACDLRGEYGWPDIEYAQVGLIDGPGNPPCAYAAAALTLAMLLDRHNVLVYCHTGSRAVAVALMYLNMVSNHGWDEWYTLLCERAGIDLPIPHPAHKTVFDGIDWKTVGEGVVNGY